ncbi:hypothetical protein GN244_ATG14645 [Phytophthora infestans]|uniref:Uncharacterized protein n=1 Tax=Phytophthora infestans TaxID=4787 RepID=A0A833T3Q7_PHYIN|nr:hypothetical protein GN244_ATG14645 [Phytophthora infestans]KAF4142209.1 hypothetical protein GN958_ATG08385 [Phytophthora infestans]
MEKYQMDVLPEDKQAKVEKKALLAKRQLQNAFDESPDLTKRRHVAVTKNPQRYTFSLLAIWVAQNMIPLSIIEDPGLLEFIRYITYDLGGITIDMPGAT